jgi:hypothetical protein
VGYVLIASVGQKLVVLYVNAIIVALKKKALWILYLLQNAWNYPRRFIINFGI